MKDLIHRTSAQRENDESPRLRAEQLGRAAGQGNPTQSIFAEPDIAEASKEIVRLQGLPDNQKVVPGNGNSA